MNHAGLAQEFRRAIRGPGEARPDGRILWDLAGRRGLFNPALLRNEMSAIIAGFGPLAAGQLGEHGVLLPLGGAPDPFRTTQAAGPARQGYPQP